MLRSKQPHTTPKNEFQVRSKPWRDKRIQNKIGLGRLYQIHQYLQREDMHTHNNHNSFNRILFMITDNEKSQMIEHFMAQVKTEDLLNIGFMKPIEVALRTHKNDKEVHPDSLPKGLMIAAKSTINDNKYTLRRVPNITPQTASLEQLRANHMDNYISLLKKTEEKDQVEAERMSQIRKSSIASINPDPEPQESEIKTTKRKGMEIGICVSMAGQDKRALKKTLVGVADNIDQLIRSGVSPDDIFVLVVIDGVQKVDKSLYEYFQQFQRQSQIFLQEDEKLTIRKKYQHQLYHSEVEHDQPLNYSKFLFTEDEFAERIDSKFVNIRKKYDEIMRIKGSIQNIKKQHQKDNDNLKMIVNRLADKQKTILKKINKGKNDKKIVINEESIMKELASSEEECNQYVNTRQDLAYVAVYRLPTTSLSEECRIKYADLNRKDNNEQEESALDSDRLLNDQMERGEEEDPRKSLVNKKGNLRKQILYVNLFFCIKYKEAGKLNSHNWFFNGFCQELNPRFSFLLDVGVKPYKDSIFKMYRHMMVNPKVGGVCGYLRLVEEQVADQQMVKEQDVDCLTSCLNTFFDIQRAQQIQTHYDYFLEKSFEALFRFIHVVPGSFSGYSMEALRPPGKKGDELLREYFRSVDEKIVTNKIVPSQFTVGSIMARIFLPKTIWKRFVHIDPDSEEQLLYNQNTYQAENRVLCLGIHKNKKDISFLPNVYAQVEPIKQINDLMEDKKLQINGGMFSFEKVNEQFETVTRKRQKFLVRFQLTYISFMKFLSFFAPAFLIFAIQFATEIIQTQFLANLLATESESGLGNVLYRTFSNIIIFFYALCILAVFFFSIHLNSKEKRYVYYAHLISTILGIFTVISIIVFIVQLILSILKVGNSYLHKQYVIQLSTFLAPSFAEFVATLLRVIIFAAIGVILLPSFIYSFAFGKFGVLWECIVGIPAYIFYFPTYVCILPIYARCRLDDIYSGDSFKNLKAVRNQNIKQAWKIVKMIDVAKYLFWNLAVGVTLLILHSVLLVKFFMLLFLLTLFTILSLIKLIPSTVYIIRYKWHKRKHPLEPTVQQRQRNLSQIKLRVFDTIKLFQDDFSYNIRQAFQGAAVLAQSKQIEKQNKKQATNKKQPEPSILLKPDPQIHNRNQSIQFNNIVDGNQQNNLNQKLQYIRESSALKGSYYPFQFGKKDNKVEIAPPTLPLEMVLLKNKMAKEAEENKDLKQEEIKLKKYQDFRTSVRPVIL